jgi:hypothetical protein
MPRRHKPCYRKARNARFVEIDASQHNLSPNKDEAFTKFHKLMPERPKLSADHLALILDQYLRWLQAHRSPAT